MQGDDMAVAERGAARTMSRATALGPDGGTPFWFLNNLARMKATAATTGGAYGLFESIVPSGFSPPLHVHHREDEAFWVLSGALTIRCGDDTFGAPAGSFAFLPRGVPHSFVVESDEPVRMLTLISPGGGEQFFVAAGRPAEFDGLPPNAPVDRAMLARVAAEFDMELVGPPLTRSGT
jgi:mannose-6-phosphate isomerase-like protein (cupin superfamily)